MSCKLLARTHSETVWNLKLCLDVSLLPARQLCHFGAQQSGMVMYVDVRSHAVDLWIYVESSTKEGSFICSSQVASVLAKASSQNMSSTQRRLPHVHYLQPWKKGEEALKMSPQWKMRWSESGHHGPLFHMLVANLVQRHVWSLVWTKARVRDGQMVLACIKAVLSSPSRGGGFSSRPLSNWQRVIPSRRLREGGSLSLSETPVALRARTRARALCLFCSRDSEGNNAN